MTAQLLDMPAGVYHQRGELSHSRLEVFLEDPALYEGRFITGEFHEEKSAAMDFGTLVHDAVLQGGVDCVVQVIPPDVLSSSGSRAGAAWKQFAAEHAGKYLLKAHEAANVRRAVDSLWKHPKAKAILDFDGDNEQSLFWTDEETGIDMRARLDRLTPVFIADVKTTNTTHPKRFAKAVIERGYHRQGALYQDAVESLGEWHACAFVIVAVRNEPPYSVETFVPDNDFMELGRRENREALGDFAECEASGVWKRKGWGSLVELPAPRWALFNS